MAKENEQPKIGSGVNERAVRAYMLSQDASVAEAIEKLRENPDKRVDLDQVVAAKE